MLMLTLDDAVKVAQRLIADGVDDKAIIRQELEQKCWLPPARSLAAERLRNLIWDINPHEICAQIEDGNFQTWCGTIQSQMQMAVVQLPCWTEDDGK